MSLPGRSTRSNVVLPERSASLAVHIPSASAAEFADPYSNLNSQLDVISDVNSERDAEGEEEDEGDQIILPVRTQSSRAISIPPPPPEIPDLTDLQVPSEHTSEDLIIAAESSDGEAESSSQAQAGEASTRSPSPVRYSSKRSAAANAKMIIRNSIKDPFPDVNNQTPRAKASSSKKQRKNDTNPIQSKLNFTQIINTPTAFSGARAMPDKECSFCEGTTLNRAGAPEDMVSCFRCGNSGHFTCMQFFDKKLIETVKSYDWFCMECKICELCGTKGIDANLCLCDVCDRGYHCTCLSPPSSKPPKGGWICDPCSSHPGQGVASTVKSFRTSHKQSNGLKTPNLKRSQLASPSLSRPLSPRKFTNTKNNPTSLLKQATTSTQTNTLPRSSRSRQSSVPPQPPLPKVTVTSKPQLSSANGSTKVRFSRKPASEGQPTNPYYGMLSEAEANTSFSTPEQDDLILFQKSLSAADKLLGSDRIEHLSRSTFIPKKSHKATSIISKTATSVPEMASSDSQLEFPLPRSMRDRNTASNCSHPRLSIGDFTVGSVEKVHQIRFGNVDIPTWYTAPYPEEYSVLPDGRLWICEHCLSYKKTEFGMYRHSQKCKMMQPPGDEIYRYDDVSVYEVDGRKSKIYCQNLCLLSKLFLDHKTLYYDVDPFMFYVLTTKSGHGMEFVGYFSKEKRSGAFWNLSCIMTLPIRSRKGWGGWLVSFSYLLSMKEGRVGSPERPLSDLGLITYTNYWTLTIFEYLAGVNEVHSIQTISDATSMTLSDICFILERYKMLQLQPAPAELVDETPTATDLITSESADTVKINNGFGQNAGIEDLSGDVTVAYPPKYYRIQWDSDLVNNYLRTWISKGYARVNKEAGLRWSPILTALCDESAETLAGMTPMHAIRAGIREEVWQKNYGHMIPKLVEQSQMPPREKTKKIKTSNLKSGITGKASTTDSALQSAATSRASTPPPIIAYSSSGDEYEPDENAESGGDNADISFE